MDVYEAVDSRRAVRAFSDREVPRDLLDRVLLAAARSPSSGNLQPWQVFAVSGAPLAELKARATARGWQCRQEDVVPRDVPCFTEHVTCV